MLTYELSNSLIWSSRTSKQKHQILTVISMVSKNFGKSQMSCTLLLSRLLELQACCLVLIIIRVVLTICFFHQMLVEYDVLARDHQDAYVSFIILVNFCQW